MPISNMRRPATTTNTTSPASYAWDMGAAASASVSTSAGVDLSVQLTGAIVIALVAAIVVMSMKWPIV